MTANDRTLLRAFLRTVDTGDVIALPPDSGRFDQSDGHYEAQEVAKERGIAQPTWLFWHQQAGKAFDFRGDLTGPLRINWGGDHARVGTVLAGLVQQHPGRYAVTDNGPSGTFDISRTDLAVRAAAAYPDIADESAVKARIQLVTEHGYETTDSDWAWLNEVLIHGDVKLRGKVAPHLVADRKSGGRHVTDEAFEVLMADWAKIYGKVPEWAMATDLLETLRERDDPRLDEVLATCVTRRSHTFYASASSYLEKHGDPESLETLYGLAQRPGRCLHTPGDRTALRAWVALRARSEGRTVVEVVRDALSDEVFDAPARRGLVEIALASVPESDRPVLRETFPAGDVPLGPGLEPF